MKPLYTSRFLRAYSGKSIAFHNAKMISPQCQNCNEVAFSPMLCEICHSTICRNCVLRGNNPQVCPRCNKCLSPSKKIESLTYSESFPRYYCKFRQKGCFASTAYPTNEHEILCRFNPYNNFSSSGSPPNSFKKEKFIYSQLSPISKTLCEFCLKDISKEDKMLHFQQCLNPATTSFKKSPDKIIYRRAPTVIVKRDICMKCKRDFRGKSYKICRNCNLKICINCTKACLFCKAYYCLKCIKNCPHSISVTLIQKKKEHELDDFISSSPSNRNRNKKDFFLWKIANLLRFLKNKEKLKISKIIRI